MPPADLASAVQELAVRDPELVSLPVLLDTDRLTEWLETRLGRPVEVRRRYLRYKPAASCVLSATLDSPSGPVDLVVAGFSPSTPAKAVKTVATAAGPAAVVAVDPALRLIATTSVADRHLPALGALADSRQRSRVVRRLLELEEAPDPGGLRLATLSYKPHRRWAGELTLPDDSRFVLRAYPTGHLRDAVVPLAELTVGSAPTQRLVGHRRRLGLVALEYVEGRTLDEGQDTHLLRAAGRALAHLHQQHTDLRALPPNEDVHALRRSARQVAKLLPDLTARLDELVDETRRRLAEPSNERAQRVADEVTLHGDFSLDQVVTGPDETITLIDLDRARRGPAAADLGSLAAAAVVNGAPLPWEILAQVQAGYAAVRPLPDPSAVVAQTAAHLLRRAAEPFRVCRSDWPAEVSRILDTVARVLDRNQAPISVRIS